MPRKKQTKEQCWDKYDAIKDHYEVELIDANEMIGMWRLLPPDKKTGVAIWHWSGQAVRFQKALDRLPARRAKNCDWRPSDLTEEQLLDLMADICSSVQWAWEEFNDIEQDRIIAYYYRHGPNNIAANLEAISEGEIH